MKIVTTTLGLRFSKFFFFVENVPKLSQIRWKSHVFGLRLQTNRFFVKEKPSIFRPITYRLFCTMTLYRQTFIIPFLLNTRRTITKKNHVHDLLTPYFHDKQRVFLGQTPIVKNTFEYAWCRVCIQHTRTYYNTYGFFLKRAIKIRNLVWDMFFFLLEAVN